jgi:SAM-dependent methyltransferase
MILAFRSRPTASKTELPALNKGKLDASKTRMDLSVRGNKLINKLFSSRLFYPLSLTKTYGLSLWKGYGLRLYCSKKYIRGSGLEIGALNKPLRLFNGANVLYVDRKNIDELRSDYPELEHGSLVNVDIIDDGESLNTIDDSSVDFVIANHFLEHCEDPIMALETFIRVVRPGGILFFAVPDKRYTEDRDRNLTTLEHLIADHRFGPIISREDHFREFEECVARGPVKRDYSIHYHVWTDKEIVELLAYLEREKGLELSTLQIAKTNVEHLFVMKKN